MDINQHIIDYFDGNISSEAEAELFSLMSYDDNLRNEFRNLMHINNTIPKSIESYAPSGILTNSVFAKLGYELPVPQSPTLSAPKAAFFQSNFIKYFVVGISSAFLAIIGTLLFIKPGINSINDSKYNFFSKLDTVIPVPNSIDINKSVLDNIPKTKIKNDLVKILSKKIQKTDSAKINCSGINESVCEISRLSNVVNKNENCGISLNPSSNKLNEMKIMLSSNNRSNDNINLPKSTGLSLEVKSSANWNIPKETIYPNEISKLNNMSLVILYDISNNFKIGTELRQETFFLKYDGVNDWSIKNTYKQQSNFTSFGIVTRFNPEFNFYNFKPVIQDIISINNFGLIGRISCGFEYYIYPDISINSQAEYSLFTYLHQNNRFYSEKFSINYGINFKF